MPMIYLAMDVSKDELVLYADSTGKHYAIPNSFEAMQEFLIKEGFDPEETVVGCEATGECHTEPCMSCLKLGYNVKVLNPILTKQVINATIRKKKTDYSDTEIIAKLLADGQGQKVSEKDFQQAKRTILRTEQKLVKCCSSLKLTYQTLKKKSKNMNIDGTLESIERCIKTLEEEASKLEKESTKEQNRQEEIIDSVPGCGEKLAAIISAEAGDIKRFPSASKLKAYAGIDPKVTQSGNHLYTGKMTKRGNSMLRQALFLAANVARQYDLDLKEFYEKKRNEGKSHRHAICTVSRKLCERIYAIVIKDTFYKKNPV